MFFFLILQHFEILTDIYINACTQTTIRFLQRNTKLHSCTQAVIRFLQRNTNFYSCTYTVYRFFIAKGNIQQLYLTAIRFSQLNTKFRVALIRSLTMKYKNFKVVPNCLFAF